MKKARPAARGGHAKGFTDGFDPSTDGRTEAIDRLQIGETLIQVRARLWERVCLGALRVQNEAH